MGTYDRERAARVLVDATQYGDGKAAELWEVTTKTVRNYRQRLATDSELSSLFQQKSIAAETGWHLTRTRFLRKSIDKLEKLIDEATVEQIDVVSRAIERVGNLDVASKVLDVGTGADQSRSVASEDAEGDPEGEDAPAEARRPGVAQDARN